MKRRVAALLASGVCIVVALMFPTPASAAISQITISPTAQVSSQGAFVTVTVTYQCTPSEPANIEVYVAQARGTDLVEGYGFHFGTCGSFTQTSQILVQARSGMPYHPGQAVATASDFDGGGAFTGPVEIRLAR
ncbi:hypothetical protein AB0K04_27470 [Micromonospora coxensis]|uniref:hypothetical protein n=1 Tax=Micromonospora coxensis TaxID=356852 RepID=UPI0034346033